MAEFFKVGDHVRVRQWEDMAAEFPIRQNGNIEVAYLFTVDMRFAEQSVSFKALGLANGTDVRCRRLFVNTYRLICGRTKCLSWFNQLHRLPLHRWTSCYKTTI